MTINTAQLKVPLQLAPDGNLAVVEQGSATDLAQRVHVLCVTRPRGTGSIDGRPGFGLADQTHRKGGADLGELQRQIAAYIPEAEVTMTEQPDLFEPALQRIGVRVATR